MFKEIKKISFAEKEEEILNFWKEKQIFFKSLQIRENCPKFTFYDGPPFATGLPHYGHLLAGTIKDVIPRYKTMKGMQVSRRFGWDCHGLPIENEVEKAKNLNGAAAIEDFGIAAFNEECRSIVLRYTEEWKQTVERMGRWVDFEKTYHTMDKSFMESVWHVFKTLFEKGLVYEGFKVMPFSAKLGTPLSNFEASENYQEVDDPSLTITFPLEDEKDTSFLAWTTTPWTLVSNLALITGAEIDYVKVQDKENAKKYILAKARLSAYYKDEADYEILESFKGKELAGKRYLPLFNYFSDKAKEGAFRVLNDDFVSTEDGTGIVHAAPAFGEADFYACKAANISLVCPVDANGKFTSLIPEYEGKFVKDADKEIIQALKKAARVVQHSTIRHRYPFCWRSDTPLIYRAMETWFVAVETIKEDLLASNEQIHWTPSNIKHGRFGKWLEGARDWAISRNRYWGTPIPLWRADDGELLVVGSIAELNELSGKTAHDLHRHFIDDITIEKNGKVFRRIPEVFDCWFESGSMPYAQNHYPFKDKEKFESSFPADFIAEGLDQTRGWFYTLTVLSSALFKKPAFKNVIVNGIILAENGNKMSKRLKNYPDPVLMINKYGADVIRLYMLHSPAVKADDLRFSEKGIEQVLRQIMIPLFNAYSFLVTYVRIYKWKPDEKSQQVPEADIDRWLLSITNRLISDVEKGMDDYDLSRAVEPFVGFIDELTNWYIRRSRRRFWSDEDSPDRRSAFATLYHALLQLCRITAPFIPFMSEAIYQNLRSEEMPESIHLDNYPDASQAFRDERLEKEMCLIQKVVGLGHALRKEQQIKVRQPLPAVHIACANAHSQASVEKHKQLIQEELNVKEVLFEEDESDFVILRAKPNFRVLGKKVGSAMKEAQKKIQELDFSSIEALSNQQSIEIEIQGKKFLLENEDIEIERIIREGMVAANEDSVTVLLDTSIDEILLLEGLARELVNKINSMRRDAGFHVSDRIAVKIDANEKIHNCFDIHGAYIREEVLAKEVNFTECEGTLWDLNGTEARIQLTKL